MKKTFALRPPGKDQPRVLESVKNDVRKYVKRERRKPLPEGVDFWDFDCKVGADQANALSKHPAEVIPAIDAMAAAEAGEVYVEVLAKPGYRAKKITDTASTADDSPEPNGLDREEEELR